MKGIDPEPHEEIVVATELIDSQAGQRMQKSYEFWQKQSAVKVYLSGSLVMAELAQEIDLLHKLLLIEAQVKDPAHQSPLLKRDIYCSTAMMSALSAAVPWFKKNSLQS